MGQANLLQATESMSGPLVAPPQEAWVRIDRQRVLVPMVPQVLVQVVQQGPPRSEHCRQRATEPVARLDLGEGGGSEIDVGGRGNDGARLGIGANCAAVLGAGVEAGVEAVPAGGLDVERAEVL